ncbi:PmoA family protein [Marinactinospora rubrisoli]|uniref:PmoA family protein n=1 Tax=Marinactinospora rubrisoli TaxID=2715399 RepID=A0ABW2KP83_9ACTN
MTGERPEETSAGAPVLRLAGRVLATHHDGADLDPLLSPRPYLHPVRTLGGTTVSEFQPEDHAHHLGVGVAVADVAGANFWGGRTFVRDRGSTMLANHGRQEHVSWDRRADDGYVQRLAWRGPDGTVLLEERRTVRAVPVAAPGGGAWALDIDVRLRNSAGRPLRIGSPATNGRPGAGYGGFFWRAPLGKEPPRCLGPGLEGEEALHGTRAPWLAMSGAAPGDGAPWTLVFLAFPPDPDPWFLRAGQYPGVGAALAWDRPLWLDTGGWLRRRTATVVLDGHPAPAGLDALVPVARSALEAAAGAEEPPGGVG